MKIKITIKSRLVQALMLFLGLTVFISACSKTEQPEAYLFAYFTGNGPGEEAIRFAVSMDGYNYMALNNNEPVIDSKTISTSGGVRDPHLLRGANGHTYYMVATDLYVTDMGWNNYALILMKSTNLIDWESTVINIPELYSDEFGEVDRVWAPQTIYDEKLGKYMVYFSMKQRGNHPDIIYYAYANSDFTGFEEAPKQLYYPPEGSNTKACIDGDIVAYNNKFHLFYKAEDGNPGIKLAVSDSLSKGYQLLSDERVDCEIAGVEGSGIFKLNNSDEFILMYDVYTRGRYQFTKSTDLKNFEVIDEEISMNFHPRHGTVMPITLKELKNLINKWGHLDNLLVRATSRELKSANVYFNGKSKTIHLPVKRGVNLKAFDPQFNCMEGYQVNLEGPQDFTKGTVDYVFSIEGKGEAIYKVTASEDHNPV